MSDEHLRELERRWRSTGALADRLALLRERARLLDAPGDRHRLSVHDHDPAAARAAVTRALEARLPALEAAAVARPPRKPRVDLGGLHRDRWQQDLVVELNRALETAAGPWFEGLGAGLGMERWCACHKLFGYGAPPRVASIPTAVDNVMAHVTEMHGVHARLLDLFDAIPLPSAEAGDPTDALRDALRRLTEFVVRETGCDDAWYCKPRLALDLLVQDKGLVVPPAALDQVEEVFSASFQSWIAPAEEQLEAGVDEAALALARAWFEARYGPA